MTIIDSPNHDEATVSMKVVLLAFAVVLVGALGYLVYLQNNTPTSEVETEAKINLPSPSGEESESETSTAEDDEMASWTNYTNTKYGYSLKYPNTGWYVYGYKDGDEPTTDVLSIAVKNDQDRSHLISVSKGDNSDMEETLKEDASKVNFQKTAITFLGQAATQYTWTFTLSGEKLNDNKTIKVINNGYTYYLAGITKDYAQLAGTDRGNFEKILSTFKFTN